MPPKGLPGVKRTGHSSCVPSLTEASLTARAVRGLEELGPWRADLPVALACSGGADSTFLALAWKAFAAGRAIPAEAWVVDHGHRPGTDDEAAAAADLYAGLDLPVHVLRARAGSCRETELRAARYRAFARAGRERGVRVVVTAHHADDTAETVLLRILRGTGLRGLAGIPARRAVAEGLEVRRPLLALRRAAIRRELAELGQEWIEDPTNGDPGVAARNRLRGELLPLLGGLATGDPVEAVLRLVEEGREWREGVAQLLAEGRPWRELPGALRREAVAAELRRQGATVSPARLRDLESALLRRGSAGVDDHWRLSIAGGRLQSLSRTRS